MGTQMETKRTFAQVKQSQRTVTVHQVRALDQPCLYSPKAHSTVYILTTLSPWNLELMQFEYHMLPDL